MRGGSDRWRGVGRNGRGTIATAGLVRIAVEDVRRHRYVFPCRRTGGKELIRSLKVRKCPPREQEPVV